MSRKNSDVTASLAARGAAVRAFTPTLSQMLAVLAVSFAGFLGRILADPLVTVHPGARDMALVAAIWLIWGAAVGLTLVLARHGARGGATIVGLCLGGAVVSVVDLMTPGFLLPVGTFVALHLGLALFGLALAFRLVPQVVPGGRAARWADGFGFVGLPACAIAAFVAVMPLADYAGATTGYLGDRRAEVVAKKAASDAVVARQAAAVALTARAPRDILPASASEHSDGRAALALLLLTIGNSSAAVQASW